MLIAAAAPRGRTRAAAAAAAAQRLYVNIIIQCARRTNIIV